MITTALNKPYFLVKYTWTDGTVRYVGKRDGGPFRDYLQADRKVSQWYSKGFKDARVLVVKFTEIAEIV